MSNTLSQIGTKVGTEFKAHRLRIETLEDALDSKITSTEKGVANGVATLDATGKVPSNQLPSYVDDVVEATNLAGFPATGETGKIYVALDTNKAYRWSGSAYIYITSGAVDSVAGKTGVVTLVKGDVGLGNVDNTSDATKNVLSATKLTTARTLTLNGDVTGSVSFDGSANITLTTANVPANLLAGLKTVDGSGSGLDADLLDGQQGSWYQRKAGSSINLYISVNNTYLVTDEEANASEFVINVNGAGGNGGVGTVTFPANMNKLVIITCKASNYSWVAPTLTIQVSGGGSVQVYNNYVVLLSFSGNTVKYAFKSLPTDTIATTPAIGDTSNRVATTNFVSNNAVIISGGSSGAAAIPAGTTAQRPATPTVGYTRYNTDLVSAEVWNGTAWGSLGGGATGSGTDKIFNLNGQTVTANYSIPSGQNAMTAGPISINDGVTVTIPDGSTWTVV